MPYVEVEPEIRLYYEDWGSGPPVVFIHGWPLSHEMWEYQLNTLPAQGVRCIAYDRRGFGQSDKPYAGYDYDTLARDLHALLEKLDLRGVTLVGYSMGGGEVVRYLRRHGNAGRINKAVLVSSVVPYMLQTDDNPKGLPRAQFDGFIAKLEEDRPAFLEDFGKLFYGVGVLKKPVSQALLDWTQQLALRASPIATRACVRAFSETDFRPDLAALNVPTLVVHGDADKVVPIGVTSQQVKERVPRVQLEVYEGAPHATFYAERERLNRDLIAFVHGER